MTHEGVTSTPALAPGVRRVLPAVLRERDFRRFWLGETVSLLGDQISLIALPLVAVLELDASASQMGFLAAAGLVPNLLFSLHAGAWLDRRGRRRQTMITTALGRAALLFTIPLAYAVRHVQAGIRYIANSPIVRASLLATATINFFNFIFWALFILYATRGLGVRPGLLGLVLGAASIGA